MKLHKIALNQIDDKPEYQKMLDFDVGYQLAHERLGIGKGVEVIKGEVPYGYNAYGH